MSLRLAGRFARREMRGGLRGFRLFLACLALGVAAIAAVGSVRSAIEGGLQPCLVARQRLISPIVSPPMPNATGSKAKPALCLRLSSSGPWLSRVTGPPLTVR